MVVGNKMRMPGKPLEWFARLAEKPHLAFLDSARSGSYSVLAIQPSIFFSSRGRSITIHWDKGNTQTFEANPFEVLSDLLDSKRRVGLSAENLPNGAAIGFWGYDLKNLLEPLSSRAQQDIDLPDCWFGFYDELLIFNHCTQNLIGIGRPEILQRWRSYKSSHIPLSVSPPSSDPLVCPFSSNFTRAAYLDAIARIQSYIAAGDVYQVNLSQRFHTRTEGTSPTLYLALRQCNPAPFAAYLDIGNAQILSSSPESFLRMQGRHVQSRPIKGTRPRTGNASSDAIAVRELLMSPKDQSELLMITDLLRNDLGKVCVYGSVVVPELVRLEEYATVFHLVSTIEGILRDEVSHVEALRSCFPSGSVTGAPKIRAMEIIDELEPHRRGVYTGAIGYFGYNNVSHFNVAIRTVIKKDDDVYFHAGGGIVADSHPVAEYDETLAKAAGMTRALEKVEEQRLNTTDAHR